MFVTIPYFDWINMFVVALITIISMSWLHNRPKTQKYYYSVFFLFLMIYAGIGYSWSGSHIGYLIKYAIYFLVFGLACSLFTKRIERSVNPIKDNELLRFVFNYHRYFVIAYISLGIAILIMNGNQGYLFHFRQPDLISAVNEDFNGEENSAIGSFLGYIKHFIYPFYLLSLYCYKKQLKKFAIVYILPLYVAYADSGYMGRGAMMITLIIFYLLIWINYPKYHKKIVIGSVIAIPVIVMLLVAYSEMRIGREVTDFRAIDAFKLLAYQETIYPLHYEIVMGWGMDINLLFSYLYWIVTLPLPGFMKSQSIDMGFNFIFSERLTGITRGEEGYNVLLPGIVNESIFIFGPILFVFHAVILAAILSWLYKNIKYKTEFLLLIYCIINTAYSLGRAGTTAIYPFIFKDMLIYFVLRYFIINKSLKKKNGNTIHIIQSQ